MTAPEPADQRERLEAAARAFAVHFNDPVLLFPDVFSLEALQVVIAFHARQYAQDLATASEFI